MPQSGPQVRRTGRRKVIVSCAVTGSIHVPSQSASSADHAGADRRAGDRRGGGGRGDPAPTRARSATMADPTPDPDVFMQFLPEIRARHRRGDQHHHRRRPGHDARRADGGGAAGPPEMCSLNMGSMNFGPFRMARGIKNSSTTGKPTTLKAAARLHLPQHVSRTSRHILKTIGAHGTRSNSSATTSATSIRSPISSTPALVKPPLFVQTIFGILGGIGPDRREPRAHEKHRGPTVRRRATAGRSWARAGTRRTW